MKIFKRIQSWINKLLGKIWDEMKEHSKLAVDITQGLKNILDTNAVDILTAIIPGTADEAVVHWLRSTVPQVAFKVAVGHNILQASADPEQALLAISDYLRSLSKEDQGKFFAEFAAELLRAFSDGKLTWAELMVLTQMVYIQYYKKLDEA